MKKIIIVLAIAALLAGCGSTNSGAQQATKIRIVATVTPHAELLEYITPDLLERGVEIEIIDAPDYQMPNRALADKDAEANFFQHVPYLTAQIADFGYEIESLVGIHIEPMGLYSQKIGSINDLPDGAVISIPNDPSNCARSLALLHNHGIIQLNDPTNLRATALDIVSNPKNLVIQEIDAAMLSRTLEDVDGSIINSNYAMQADLVPTRDSLIMESPENNPFVNLVAIRKEDAGKPEFQILKEVMTSDKVRDFLLEKYEGAVVPAF